MDFLIFLKGEGGWHVLKKENTMGHSELQGNKKSTVLWVLKYPILPLKEQLYCECIKIKKTVKLKKSEGVIDNIPPTTFVLLWEM